MHLISLPQQLSPIVFINTLLTFFKSPIQKLRRRAFLIKGSERRQIAATNFNDHSSRSHSVFIILGISGDPCCIFRSQLSPWPGLVFFPSSSRSVLAIVFPFFSHTFIVVTILSVVNYVHRHFIKLYYCLRMMYIHGMLPFHLSLRASRCQIYLWMPGNPVLSQSRT